jgi:hypothetical protein
VQTKVTTQESGNDQRHRPRPHRREDHSEPSDSAPGLPGAGRGLLEAPCHRGGKVDGLALAAGAAAAFFDDLVERTADAVLVRIADRGRPAAPAALLDRRRLAESLAISPAALDRLRAEPGFPELRIGDAPRFEVARVLEWLRARSEAPALRVVGGAK